jgi:hypothetical protein
MAAAPFVAARANTRRVLEPGIVSIVLLGLLGLSALFFAVALLPRRVLATLSPSLARRRPDLAFGGLLLAGALALAFLVSMGS